MHKSRPQLDDRDDRMKHTRKLERHGRDDKDDKDEMALSGTYALKLSVLNLMKSFEELAEVAEGTLKPAAPGAATVEQHDLSKK